MINFTELDIQRIREVVGEKNFALMDKIAKESNDYYKTFKGEYRKWLYGVRM